MTVETLGILKGTPLARLAGARRRNAALLLTALPDLLWPCRQLDFAPLAMPIRIARRDAIAAELATRRIFCARHWSTLPSDPAAYPAARRLSAQLLSLPCAHDCDLVVMRRIVQALRDAGAEPAAD